MDTDSQEVLLLLRDGPRIFDPEVSSPFRASRSPAAHLTSRLQTAPKVLVYHFEEDGNLAADILRINERQKETIEDHGYHGAVFRLYLNVARFEVR